MLRTIAICCALLLGVGASRAQAEVRIGVGSIFSQRCFAVGHLSLVGYWLSSRWDVNDHYFSVRLYSVNRNG
jgi:hypothetical protein